jgi:transcriptional regulator GlxA family with amidase domain
MHTVSVLAMDGVVAFDLATPIETFTRARLPDGRPAYRVRACGPAPQADAGTFTLHLRHGLEALERADTIVVPGLADPSGPVPQSVLDALRAAAASGTRIATICVGAFTLAAAGLLDGLRATTHWAATSELARRYPAIRVDPSVLYVDNGQFLTSAGAAAGLDLCLHMIRRDHGAAVAADTARCCVMPLERDGGQAQFIVHAPPLPGGSSLAPLLAWLEEHCADTLDLASIADQAGLSVRTLSRRFAEQTGATPLQWLHQARLRQAQYLLETTSHPIERIATQVGFTSATTFRERFRSHLGVSPQSYRRSFRGRTT